MGRLTSHAVNFTLNTRWEELPMAVQHQSKRCLMDALGALIAGTQTPVADIMRQTAAAQFGGDQATIMVSGERASAARAPLANGFCGNALDIDDGYRNVKGHPRNTEEAQYSLAFPVAAALLDGEVGPRQVPPPRLHDPKLLALLDRVSTEAAPEFEAEFPAKAPAEVIVETDAGRSFCSGRIEAMWEPPHTLPTDKELEAKFLWLVGPVIGTIAAQRLAGRIWSADRWTGLDPNF